MATLFVGLCLAGGWYFESKARVDQARATLGSLKRLNAEFVVRNGLTYAPSFVTTWSIQSRNPMALWTRKTLEGLPLMRIEGVYLHKVKDVEAALNLLPNLPPLHCLKLSNSRVMDKHLRYLRQQVELDELNLSHSEVTDAGLCHLQNLTLLRDLNLGYTNVSDAGLEHLQPLCGLVNLSLLGDNVSDRGIRRLAGFDNLRSLNLCRTRISDDGLRTLQGMKELRYLDVTETDVTATGVGDFQRAFPACTIRHGAN